MQSEQLCKSVSVSPNEKEMENNNNKTHAEAATVGIKKQLLLREETLDQQGSLRTPK